MPIRNLASRARLAGLAVVLTAAWWSYAPTGAFAADEVPAAPPTSEGIEFFEKHIRPLFAQNCLKCHGEKQQGGLRLDSRASAMRRRRQRPGDCRGQSGRQPVDAGGALSGRNQDASRRQAAARGDRRDRRPGSTMGAPWPAESATAAPVKAADAWKSHWAFQPVRKPPLPPVAGELVAPLAARFFRLDQARSSEGFRRRTPPIDGR